MKRLHGAACATFVAACAASYPIAAWEASGGTGVGTLAVLQMGVATLSMLVAWRAQAGEDGGALRRLLLAGLVARLLVLPAWPYTSNDAERYLWDGRVALEGLDPYRVTPDDEAVRGLREVWATPPEHAHLPTLYPPAALAAFALAATAGAEHAHLAWKGICAAVGCALLAASLQLLRLHGRTRHLAWVALSPLLVLEIGLAAHVDAFSALAVVSALWASACRRHGWAGVAIGVGVLFKLLPGVLLLPLGVAARGRDRRALVLGAASSIAGGYLAAFALGLRPIGSLGFFFEHWRFGSPLVSGLEAVAPGAWVPVACLALLAAGLLLASTFARRAPIRAVQAALAMPLLVSPVVFPWYLCALVPVLALAPSGFLIAWLVTHPLTYEVLDGFSHTGVWAPAGWPLLAVGAAWMAGLAWDARSVRVAIAVGRPLTDPRPVEFWHMLCQHFRRAAGEGGNMKTGAKLGIAGLLVSLGCAVAWFQMAEAVAIPENRTAFVLVFLAGASLGVAAFVKGAGWIGGVAAAGAIVVGLFLSFTMSISRQEVATTGIQVGDTIPHFTQTNAEGQLFDSKSLGGKPVLMKFFRAHW